MTMTNPCADGHTYRVVGEGASISAGTFCDCGKRRAVKTRGGLIEFVDVYRVKEPEPTQRERDYFTMGQVAEQIRQTKAPMSSRSFAVPTGCTVITVSSRNHSEYAIHFGSDPETDRCRLHVFKWSEDHRTATCTRCGFVGKCQNAKKLFSGNWDCGLHNLQCGFPSCMVEADPAPKVELSGCDRED